MNLKHPLRRAYQIAFLKLLIKELEKRGNEEICDGIFENLTTLMMKHEEESEFSYKHLLINENNFITVKDSNSFIRDGTTGLKLWPAALKLSEFILKNPEYFRGKSVLELGSGASGFVGLTLLKSTEAKQIFLSDCHEVVLKNLIENLNLNLPEDCEFLETSLLIRKRLKINSKDFGVFNLPWEDIEDHKKELMSLCTPHILLAADVIYDETIFNPLIQCLNALFDTNGNHSPEFILSQTIRNEETFHKFCELLSANSFTISSMSSFDSDNVIFPCEDDNVKMFNIKKALN